MKGTIVKCLEGLILEKFGAPTWKQILTTSGMPESSFFTTTTNVPDADVVKMIGATATVLKITGEQAMEAFGEYWSTKYAPSIYEVYFAKAKTAREFLMSLDGVHVAMTKNAGAQPPRFTYKWTHERELVMTYSSARGLVALMPGLIRGVGKYYRETVDVTVTGNDVKIQFTR